MNVLMTTDTVGGVLTYARELTAEIVHRGCRVTLAAMGGPLPEGIRDQLRALPGLELAESEYRLEWMSDPWRDVARAGRWLLELEARCRPDVVHLNGFAHGALAWNTPILMVGHSCVLSWWRGVRGSDAPPEWDRYRRHVRRGLAAADLIAAPTAAMLAALEKHYGPLGATCVIPNGRDPRAFPPGPKMDLILCATGRLWDEAKNVATLDAAAGQVRWPVFVAGDERHPEGGTLRIRHARALGSPGPEVLRSWFARAAIYALPALYEPFGLSALEAALAGCALVLGDIPSLREIWDGCALFVPPRNRFALTAALDRLIDDPALRRDLAHRARVRAFEFGRDRMALEYLSIYRTLAAAVPASRGA